MTKVLISTIFLLVQFLTFAQSAKINVQILQNNQYLSSVNNVYELKSDEFSFVIEGEKSEGFLVGATFDEDVYRSAKGEADLEVAWFEATGMAEELFNKGKKMFVSNNAPSYWYFTDATDHRFDKKSKGNFDKWNAKRTIESFEVIELDKTIHVNKFKESLYIYMYQPIYDEAYNLVDRILIFNGELKFSKK